MRAPLLALLGLLVAATPAFAARQSDRSHGGQQRAKVSAPASSSAGKPSRTASTSRHAAARTSSGSRGHVATASRGHRASAPHGRAGHAAAQSRYGRNYAASTPAPVCRGNTRNCRLYRVSAPQPMRWSQGLAPALNVQTSTCPAGTMAMLATGHSSVVRCMPI